MPLIHQTLLLLLINLILHTTSAHTCVTCQVTTCQAILDEMFYVQIPAHSSSNHHSDNLVSCTLLNEAIYDWLSIASPGLCSGYRLAELACEQLVVMNQTQIGCDSSSMAIDPSFTSRCQSLIQCNIPAPERITRNDACGSAKNFVDSLHFDMGPISLDGCVPCRVRACDGWSTPSTMLTRAKGKVELYLSQADIAAKITCPSLQHVAHILANSPLHPNNPLSRTTAMNATCYPLAEASLDVWSDRFCGLRAQLYEDFDPVVFDQLTVSRGALKWPHICPKYLHSVYDAEIAKYLMSLGYCNSPTTGFLKFVTEFTINSTMSSSTGPSGSDDNNGAAERSVSLIALSALMLIAFI